MTTVDGEVLARVSAPFVTQILEEGLAITVNVSDASQGVGTAQPSFRNNGGF